jgi:hypothetical protein
MMVFFKAHVVADGQLAVFKHLQQEGGPAQTSYARGAPIQALIAYYHSAEMPAGARNAAINPRATLAGRVGGGP